MSQLFPKEFFNSVYDINYEQLYKSGSRGILFDIDNTLAPYDMAIANKKIIRLIRKLQDMGYQVSLVSNNSVERVNIFNQPLKLATYPRAQKPFTKNLRRAMEDMGLNTSQMIFVGDQVFTDVWAGNRIGFTTVLVKPIQIKEQLITRVKRGTESIVLYFYHKKRKK